jgi:hypothetical protein
MTSFLHAFADELVKVASESLGDVVGAEALGPIPSVVKGFRRAGIGGAARAGGAYVLGGGAGALGGALAAKVIHHALGRDVGVGPIRLSTALPAVGSLVLGLKAEQMANR